MEKDRQLSPKMIRAIRALLVEPTILKAAERSGVGYSTIRAWMKTHAGFQAELAKMSEKLHRQMQSEVQDHFRLWKE